MSRCPSRERRRLHPRVVGRGRLIAALPMGLAMRSGREGDSSRDRRLRTVEHGEPVRHQRVGSANVSGRPLEPPGQPAAGLDRPGPPDRVHLDRLHEPPQEAGPVPASASNSSARARSICRSRSCSRRSCSRRCLAASSRSCSSRRPRLASTATSMATMIAFMWSSIRRTLPSAQVVTTSGPHGPGAARCCRTGTGQPGRYHRLGIRRIQLRCRSNWRSRHNRQRIQELRTDCGSSWEIG